MNRKTSSQLVSYEIIQRIVGGDELALIEILPYFERTINRMSTVRYKTDAGQILYHIDEDRKGDLQSTVMFAASRFKIR